jgi:hypothetical protein
MAATTYTVEGTGYLSYDRYKRSDDVVLVKGLPGKPNRLYLRRGVNPLWGPGDSLAKSGVEWWDYVESNRRIQIYSNVGVAVYGKYKFVMSKEAYEAWAAFEGKASKKYPKQTDYVMNEHLLEKQAQIEEATSEMKQEKKMFSQRNDPVQAEENLWGEHDGLTAEELVAAGFSHEKK